MLGPVVSEGSYDPACVTLILVKKAKGAECMPAVHTVKQWPWTMNLRATLSMADRFDVLVRGKSSKSRER
jgi:hypothetical protein